MPRQTNKSKQEVVPENVVEATPAPAVVVAPTPDSTKKARAPRQKKTTEDAPATEPAPAVVPESLPEEVVVDTSTKAPRNVPTRESIMAEFSELLSLLDQQITNVRDATDKTNGVRFLRTLSKRLRNLQTSSSRLMRQKQPSARKNNNSGFLKPVKISSDMAKFTGLDPSGLHSRVDVTKFLCSYIRDHNLQNPKDRRQIVADPQLSKLLGYDSKKTDTPLTYYHIQSLLKNHFTNSKTE